MSTPTRPTAAAVSITDAAAILGVSRPTVYKLIENGTLRCHKIASVNRIAKSDLYALLGLEAPATV